MQIDQNYANALQAKFMNAYNNEEREYRADIDEDVNERVAAVAPEYAGVMTSAAPIQSIQPAFNYASAFQAAAA